MRHFNTPLKFAVSFSVTLAPHCSSAIAVALYPDVYRLALKVEHHFVLNLANLPAIKFYICEN